MIVKEAKTIWAGQVWIHDKYFAEAREKNVPVRIIHEGEHMTIFPEEFDSAIHQTKTVQDKFKPHIWHKQCGIAFKPDTCEFEQSVVIRKVDGKDVATITVKRKGD